MQCQSLSFHCSIHLIRVLRFWCLNIIDCQLIKLIRSNLTRRISANYLLSGTIPSEFVKLSKLVTMFWSLFVELVMQHKSLSFRCRRLISVFANFMFNYYVSFPLLILTWMVLFWIRIFRNNEQVSGTIPPFFGISSDLTYLWSPPPIQLFRAFSFSHPSLAS